MSSFTRPLVLKYIPKLNVWETQREFTYYVGAEHSKYPITVPKGFTTDLASVPWPAIMFIPASGKYNQAAVLHDYLYSIQDRPRKECDEIFLEAMSVLGANWFKRGMMYNAVRLGGWLPWNHHKNKKEKEMKKLIVLLLGLVLLAVPAFADSIPSNIEMLDEMTLGAKVQSQDCILTSEHIDLGAEIGAFDLTNSETAKNSFYAMGVVTVKGWSIFNLKNK